MNKKLTYNTDEIIALAWEDACSFDVIKKTNGLNEAEVIKIMRQTLKPSSFQLWRKRVSGRKTKHLCKLVTQKDEIKQING
jgi:uncharacterized protein (TIGR03643 family)